MSSIYFYLLVALVVLLLSLPQLNAQVIDAVGAIVRGSLKTVRAKVDQGLDLLEIK